MTRDLTGVGEGPDRGRTAAPETPPVGSVGARNEHPGRRRSRAEPEPSANDKPNRVARRQAQTRAKLIDAARVLFTQKGIDETRIKDITDLADVGFGSFYYHFASKEELAKILLRDALEAHGRTIEAISRGLEDPAEVVAIGFRHTVRLAATDPDWGWLLVHLDVSPTVMVSALAPFAGRDVQRGVEAGRFQPLDPMISLYVMGGALLGVMRGVLDGVAPPDADVLLAEAALRMLGVPPPEASEVARRPLPAPPPSPDESDSQRASA
jgi:AcrR family transcriptional regulator